MGCRNSPAAFAGPPAVQAGGSSRRFKPAVEAGAGFAIILTNFLIIGPECGDLRQNLRHPVDHPNIHFI